MKKLFTNDKFFLAMVLCAVIGEGMYSVLALVFDFAAMIPSVIPMVISLLCLIFLYSSYRKHSKNVMKGLLGALLMAQLLTNVSLFDWNQIFSVINFSTLIFLVLNMMLFINHFIINSEHHSSRKNVKLNQLIVIVLAICNTVRTIYLMAVSTFGGMLVEVCFAFDIIGYIGMVTTIVCIESRLDAYRLDREAAGWTEEKGYPEGYVHEYQKNIK